METDNDSKEPQLDSVADSVNVGPYLKAARKRLGYSEKQVADRLHITMHYVRAIETDGYEKLPGIIFARGYIKNYAALLGLNQADLVKRFDAIVAARNPAGRAAIKPAGRRSSRHQLLFWAVALVLVSIAGYLGYWGYSQLAASREAAINAGYAVRKSGVTPRFSDQQASDSRIIAGDGTGTRDR